MRSKWLFILLGENNTGKTTFQKHVVKLLSNDNRDYRLDCNLLFQITHPHIIRKICNFSIGNRSYQEKIRDYGSIDDYFNNHFKDADFSIISSHVSGCVDDVKEMIKYGHRKFYNVCGLFFENSTVNHPTQNQEISNLNWDERWFVENPKNEDENVHMEQLDRGAKEFVQMLIARTLTW